MHGQSCLSYCCSVRGMELGFSRLDNIGLMIRARLSPSPHFALGSVFSNRYRVGALTESLIILCFSAAALSTIDGFIVAAVQTIVFDWLPSFRRDTKEWDQLDESGARSTLRLSRVLVVVVGALAVSIAYMSFGIMSFWVGMYSLMLSFFPAIFLALRRKPTRMLVSGSRVATSIVVGASASLTAAVLGTFVFPSYSFLTALPPVLAIVVSYCVLLPSSQRATN